MENLLRYINKTRDIEVRVCNREDKLLNGSDGICTKLDGTTFILLNDDLPKYQRRNAFYHELGHAMLDDWGGNDFKERMSRTAGKIEMSEFIAEIFACVMTAMELYRESYAKEEAVQL